MSNEAQEINKLLNQVASLTAQSEACKKMINELVLSGLQYRTNLEVYAAKVQELVGEINTHKKTIANQNAKIAELSQPSIQGEQNDAVNPQQEQQGPQ